MKTYVIVPDLHVEVDLPHKVCVRDITHNPYREKVRYFKTAQNAARKLRKELEELINIQGEFESEGYYIPYTIAEKLSELEEEK
tara:strand:- start:634 stop:885 length:252 start_codon:yes stop_codon:yes gene_type:complete